MPVSTVGVMGRDWTKFFSRALHAVASTDGRTADYSPFNHDFLSHTSSRIINEVQVGALAQYRFYCHHPARLYGAEIEFFKVLPSVRELEA